MSLSCNVLTFGSAPIAYPTDLFFGLLYYLNEDALEVPKRHPYQGEWGEVLCVHLPDEKIFSMPGWLDMVWLSIVERKFYSIDNELPIKKMEKLWEQKDHVTNEQIYNYIGVGMAPFGGVAIWFRGFNKSIQIAWLKAVEIEVDMADFIPTSPYITLEKYCDFCINNDPLVKENLQRNGLPPRNLFDKYMQQFCYRYLPMFEKWDEEEEVWKKCEADEKVPELDYIEESLFDGTHDKLHDGSLLKYHEAGKPKKLAMAWHIKKSEYAAYFWFEDQQICAIYDRFYGAHRETKVDFIIHVDSQKNKYQLRKLVRNKHKLVSILRVICRFLHTKLLSRNY